MVDLSKPIKVAVIGAPHGIKGEVRVKSYTVPLDNLLSYRKLFDEEGANYVISRGRLQKDMLIVKFAGIDDRNAAELLNHKVLYVLREQFDDSDDEEEYYHVDLIGLSIYTEDGFLAEGASHKKIGRITYVDNFGAGDLLEILVKGRKVLIPFTKQMVPFVSIDDGYILLSNEALALIAAFR